jgi:DNA polymerase
VPIDKVAVDNALSILEVYQDRLKKEVVEITKGEIKTIGQRAKVMAWCADQGEVLSGYDKANVSDSLKKVKSPKVKRLLEIRQALGKTSTAKFEAMKNSCALDGRIRDVLMYHGAATGRWAGKLVQFQNLPKGSIKDMPAAVKTIKLGDPDIVEMLYGNVMSFMSSAIRGMVTAREGHLLIAADFSSIEVRVLAWLSGCELMLKQFKDGADLYVEMASKIYGVPSSEITSDQRQLGKAAILGAGYGMGKAKFHATCLSWGIEVSEEMAALAINTYRNTYPEIRNFWAEMERQAKYACIARGSNTKVYNLIGGKSLAWKQDDVYFLKCYLPSGRALNFYHPRLEPKTNQWGTSDVLTFMGEKAGKSGGKMWQRVDTYGGKLVENITQAVARDLMAEAMLRIEAAGFEIILSVHDELIAEVRDEFKIQLIIGDYPEESCDIGYPSKPRVSKTVEQVIVEEFENLMSLSPSWAKGCPVEAKGWAGKHYRK